MRLGKSLLAAKGKADALHSCPICAKLGDESLLPIAEISRERSFEKNEFLAQEGDFCTGFYLVLSGRLRVFKMSPNGKEKVLMIAEPGMTFGEDALFGRGAFLQNAVAMEKTKVLSIPRAEFLNMLRRNPDLAFQVMESLCAWIRRLSSSVENIALLSATERVSRYLLGLAGNGNEVKTVAFPVKKKEIAEQIGITPETLSRIFAELERREIIEVNQKEVTFKDLEQLREAVET